MKQRKNDTPGSGLRTDITIQAGDSALLDRIAPLWKKLTLQHAALSPHFAREFRTRSFASRKRELLAKAQRGSIRVLLARAGSAGRIVGYAVGTVDRHNVAEIDSLYVLEAMQRQGVGSRLVREMLRCLRALRPASLTVNVAIGNERALGFYRRFGFFPRVTSLVLKRGDR